MNEVAPRSTLDAAALAQVAALHRRCIPTGFLATLGDNLLALVYDAVQRYPGGILLTSSDAGRIVGFVSGVDDVGRFYRWFLSRHFLRGMRAMLPKLASPSTLRRACETLLYPLRAKRQQPELPRAELLSLAVDAEHRRHGVARELYSAMVAEFRSRGISEFRIVVGAQLTGAVAFYERVGAAQAAQISVHGREPALVFVQRSESQ